MSQKERYYDDEDLYMEEEFDEIDIMELVRKLLAGWRTILKFCCVGVVVGLIAGFSLPKKYASVSKLAPEVASKTQGGSLSSLASLAGINLGGMGTGDVMSPDIFPEIVSSTPFIVELFSLPVDFKYRKEQMSDSLYEYMKEYTRIPWWSAVIQLPFKALGWTMDLIRGKEDEIEGFANINPLELTNEQEKIAKALRESIGVSVDKKTSLVTVSVVTQDRHVSAKVCQTVIENLQKYVTAYRTEKSRHDLEYYQMLFEEAQATYFESQQRYAKYADANQNVALQRVRTEEQRLQNEMNLNYELYNSCAQQLQVAKAQVQQETPVCTVLLPASVPIRSEKPSKLTLLVAFTFLAGVIACVWVLWGKDWMASLKNGSEEEEKTKTAKA